MKNVKKSLAVLSAISLLVSGCGDSSSSSSSTTTTSSAVATPTDVTVERGAVYEANVVDADGNIAVQKQSQNIYTFEDTPTYPITVTGGWIDVDSDGKKTVSDVLLSLPMYSYSNIVTPVTTYIADANESIRDSRILELETNLGIDRSELMKLPSLSIQEAMLAQNAVYSQIVSSENNMSAINMNQLASLYSDLNTTASQSSDKTATQLRVLIEEQVLNNLVLQDKLVNISLDESDMSATEKDAYLLESKDFLLSNTLANFTEVSAGELSTEYISNEITFEGIDTPLSISISNPNFSLIKNDAALDVASTTVLNGDVIKLSITTGGEFDVQNTTYLSIANEFTQELSQTMNYQEASAACSSVGLEIPTYAQIKQYNQNNTTSLSNAEYWVSDPYSWSGYGNKYVVSSASMERTYQSSNLSVVCTKTYTPISYTVTTKSDPNQAPVARAGDDRKVYYTDAVVLDASSSTDDSAIVSYEWMDGSNLLSNDMNFSKSDFSVGTHDLTLSVTDDEGKVSTDNISIIIFDTFTNILPMLEDGSIKSVSSFSNGGLTTITLGAGSQLYFKITNDLDREFTVSEFKIISSYNGSITTRASSTDTSLLSGGTLSPGENIDLGFSLTSSQTANYWEGTYTLTDVLTGDSFTNSFKWQGSVW